MSSNINADTYQGPDRRSNTGQWHLDKNVSISHILTTFTGLLAVFWFVADQNERISLNSQSIQHNKVAIEQQESRVTKNLDTINAKLDKLHELLIRGRQP